MTDDEVRPYLGTSVRATLADGRVIAGVLAEEGGHGHGHAHYAISSGPVREGAAPVREILHGAEAITQLEDASGDKAATL